MKSGHGFLEYQELWALYHLNYKDKTFKPYRAKQLHFSWQIFFCHFFKFGRAKFGHFLVADNFIGFLLFEILWPLFGHILGQLWPIEINMLARKKVKGSISYKAA